MRRLCLTAVVILLMVISAPLALASGGELEIPWHTIAGGGTAASCGGDYCLSGSAGQSVAAAASGGIYGVQGGFWAVGAAPPRRGSAIYLPLILR